MTVVVRTTDREAAVDRYRMLLGSGIIEEFAIGESGLTVTVLRGLSIVSGTEAALVRADSLVATAFVDSLAATKAALVAAGWTMAGSLGSPGTVLARDPDGYIIEFVESAAERAPAEDAR